MGPTLVWFRQDLRLDDHPALRAAVERGAPVIPVYLWSPEQEGDWAPGGASKVWLHDSLAALGEALEGIGSRLILRSGKAEQQLAKLIEETGAEALYWSRRYEPAAIERDKALKKRFADELEVRSFNAALLWEPWTVETTSGGPYKVFTPFWKACQQIDPDEPLSAPGKLPAPEKWPDSDPLDRFGLEPRIDWAGGIREAWTPGLEGARKRLEAFLEQSVNQYSRHRNRPDLDHVSRLSPHLHHGELSPRRVWRDTLASSNGKSAWSFLREIAWREFGHHLLYHFPKTTDEPLRPEFAEFPWADDAKALERWQKGKTGFPIVDAGMRQLWEIGWMHNRVRMIVASFLVKDLLIPWQEGARWFWDTLVDADLANNTLGWQWTAGCGADAAPYFRVFNPMTQGERFDPDGEYVRRWVPELADFPQKHLHQPWEAEEPPKDYPQPMVDHAEARKRALEAYEEIKK